MTLFPDLSDRATRIAFADWRLLTLTKGSTNKSSISTPHRNPTALAQLALYARARLP